MKVESFSYFCKQYGQQTSNIRIRNEASWQALAAICHACHHSNDGIIAIQHGGLHLHWSGSERNGNFGTCHNIPTNEPQCCLRSSHRSGCINAHLHETGTKGLCSSSTPAGQRSIVEDYHGCTVNDNMPHISRPHTKILWSQRLYPALCP